MDPDADLDPAIFVTFKTSTKNYFKKKFFCVLLFEGTIASFFKDKKAYRSHTQSESMFFLLFLVDDRLMANGSGSGRPNNIWILRIRIRYTGMKLTSAISCQ
jgi:hypothetical protein